MSLSAGIKKEEAVAAAFKFTEDRPWKLLPVDGKMIMWYYTILVAMTKEGVCVIVFYGRSLLLLCLAYATGLKYRTAKRFP